MIMSILASVFTGLLISFASTATTYFILYQLIDVISGAALTVAVYTIDIVTTIYNDTITGNFFFRINRLMDIPAEWKIDAIIMSIAMGILTIMMLISVLRSMTAHMTGEKISSPFQIVIRAIMVGLIIYILYNAQLDPMYKDASGSWVPTTKGLINNIGVWFSEIMNELRDKTNISLNMITLMMSGTNITSTVETSFFEPHAKLLGLFVSFTLMTAAVGAGITFIERMFSFALYVLLGPIFIAFYVTEETSEITKTWFMGILAQLFAIFVSTLCWYMAIRSFTSLLGFTMNDLAEIEEKVSELGLNARQSITEFQESLKTAFEDGTWGGLDLKLIDHCVNEKYTMPTDAAVCKAITETLTSDEKSKVALDLFDYMSSGQLSTFDQMLNLLICVTWLKICQTSEQFFNAVGFRTMPAGDTARGFIAGGASAVTALRSAGNAVGSATRGTMSNIAKGRASHIAKTEAAKKGAISSLNSTKSMNSLEIAKSNQSKSFAEAEKKGYMDQQAKNRRDIDDYKKQQDALKNQYARGTTASKWSNLENGKMRAASNYNTHDNGETDYKNPRLQYTAGVGTSPYMEGENVTFANANGEEMAFRATGTHSKDEQGNVVNDLVPVNDAAKEYGRTLASEIPSVIPYTETAEYDHLSKEINRLELENEDIDTKINGLDVVIEGYSQESMKLIDDNIGIQENINNLEQMNWREYDEQQNESSLKSFFKSLGGGSPEEEKPKSYTKFEDGEE